MRPPSGWLAKAATRAFGSAAVNDIDGRHGDAKRWRNRLDRAQVRYNWSGVRTKQYCRAAQVGHSLLEHSQPLAAHRRLERLEASDIATRPRKTGYKSSGDWIANLGEHDGGRTGQPLKLVQEWTARDHNRIRRRTDQFCRRSLCAFGIAVTPAIFDPHVAAIGPARP